MAAMVPVIAADTGGTGELVRHEYNGLLIAPRDSDALNASLRRLIQDETLQKELMKNGRETLSEFNWEDLVNQTEAVLLSAVKEA